MISIYKLASTHNKSTATPG